MKEPNFRELIVNHFRNYLSEHLTDEDIYETMIDRAEEVLNIIYGVDIDVESLQKLINFYLINSNDCKEMKELTAHHTIAILGFADTKRAYSNEIGILAHSFSDMMKVTNETRPLRKSSQ